MPNFDLGIDASPFQDLVVTPYVKMLHFSVGTPGNIIDLFLNNKSVVFQVVFSARNEGCSKNPRIQAWPNQKDYSGIIIGKNL